MKPVTLSLLLSLAGAAACDPPGSGAATASSEAAQTVQAAFRVEGMHCATCPVTVRAAAEGVDGVTSVRVSMDDAKAWVSYDPTRTSPGAIAAAITASGYKARAVGAP